MYKNMMVVVDDSPVARAALLEGVEVARTHGARVLFFHVLPNYVMPIADAPPLAYLSPDEHRKAVEGVARRLLTSAQKLARRKGLESTGLVGSHADVPTCIAEAAVENHCDLIVIGSHGRTPMQRLLFGSVVTRLITLSAVPILVCKATERVRTPKSADAAPGGGVPLGGAA